MSIKFRNPPINELVIGTYFDPPLVKLHAEHIGLFWSRVRKAYPKVFRQVPIGTIIENQDDVFPLPRFWIVSQNDTLLMQIQKNAFLFNWRKRGEEYPHYDIVKTEFDAAYYSFEDFLENDAGIPELRISVCELTYINLISQVEYWNNIFDTRNIIPSFHLIDFGSEMYKMRDFNYVSVYEIDDKLTLQLTVKTVRPVETPDGSSLVFEIRATGRLGGISKSNADEWFDRAHTAIGNCFLSITSPEIQNKYWQPKEEGS